MVTEERTCTETVCIPETRTRKVTCCEVVPVTKTVPCTYTVMVPHVQKRMETYCVAVPVTRQVTETYQVQVPTYQDGGEPTIRSAFRFGPTRRSSVR